MIFSLLSFLGLVPTFQKAKCKKLLSTTIERVKHLKSRREARLRQLCIDVAKLLQLRKKEKALVLIGPICTELCLISAYNKIATYCEHAQSNLKDIACEQTCPADLEEPLAGLCFAASCCADLPELQELREIFAMKFGREFVASAQDLEPDCHVNREFLGCLCAKDPPDHLKREILDEIIAQYKIKRGNEPALWQEEEEEETQHTMDAHEYTRYPPEHEEMDPTPMVLTVRKADAVQDRAALSTLYEEYLGTPKMAHDLVSWMKSSLGRQACHSAFKRRQVGLNRSDEEGDETSEEPPLSSSPPQRPPPPPLPPPNHQQGGPPPKRAPPLPLPLQTTSMPSSSWYMKHASNYAGMPLRRHSTMPEVQYNESYDGSHAHPRLPPKYEDFVANFATFKH